LTNFSDPLKVNFIKLGKFELEPTSAPLAERTTETPTAWGEMDIEFRQVRVV
jgi:hypothetical protein